MQTFKCAQPGCLYTYNISNTALVGMVLCCHNVDLHMPTKEWKKCSLRVTCYSWDTKELFYGTSS